MSNHNPRASSFTFDQLIANLVFLDADLPDASDPIGRMTREFFTNGWAAARDGLLSRTTKLRVEPQPSAAPHVFTFELDCRYKQKAGPDAQVELVDGTLHGTIRYRGDLFTAPAGQPTVMVFVDSSAGLYHPNYSRSHSLLCVGDVPPGPFPLEDLLEHVFRILSFQCLSTADPADREAAQYFAHDPDAMSGLETVEPLYS